MSSALMLCVCLVICDSKYKHSSVWGVHTFCISSVGACCGYTNFVLCIVSSNSHYASHVIEGPVVHVSEPTDGWSGEGGGGVVCVRILNAWIFTNATGSGIHRWWWTIGEIAYLSSACTSCWPTILHASILSVWILAVWGCEALWSDFLVWFHEAFWLTGKLGGPFCLGVCLSMGR